MRRTIFPIDRSLTPPTRQFDSIDANGRLIYANDVEDPSDLDNWVIEGPGQITLENGKLKIGSISPPRP